MSRLAVALLLLLLALSGCSKPAAPPPAEPLPSSAQQTTQPPAPSTEPAEPTPAEPSPVVPQLPVRLDAPRLLLDLPLGDDPGQPGRTPSRVGGVSPRGPLAIAVAGPDQVYLLDQAKGRVLLYAGGQLQKIIATPWVEGEVGDLGVVPEGLVLTGSQRAHLVIGGRLAESLGPLEGQVPELASKESGTLGSDRDYVYLRVHDGPQPLLRRVNPQGKAVAEVPLPEQVDLVDWYITPEGGVYALGWRWGGNQIDRALVYELLPPVREGPMILGTKEPAEPRLFNRPVPSKLKLVAPDWMPVEVTGEVDRWNLWWLLATAGPAHRQLMPGEARMARLEAAFADGEGLVIDLYTDMMSVNGTLYSIKAAVEVRRLVGALLLSPESLTAALKESRRVVLINKDLPGAATPLTDQQRQQLAQSLSGLTTAHPQAVPQPLEEPFPRYAIRLEGSGWEATLFLRGARHLSYGFEGALAHDGELTGLVRQWLPVPDFQPEELGYLYLADKVEIDQGVDITRWKNTIVRKLLQVTSSEGVGSPWKGAITFTFHVRGEKRVVLVDVEGFTYAGKRYDVSGLNHLIQLQSVP